jgi:hypothetical protein
MFRCAWCNEEGADLRGVQVESAGQLQTVYVHPEHEAELAEYYRAAGRDVGAFPRRPGVIPLVMLTAVGAAALVDGRLSLAAMGLVLVGIAMVLRRYPYAKPRTVASIGVLKTVALYRTVASMIGLLGLALLIMGLWIALPVLRGVAGAGAGASI